MPRRPEPNLEVLWQRYVPQGIGSADPDASLEAADARVDAVAGLVPDLEHALEGLYGALDRGDLVLTVSVRPGPAEAAIADVRCEAVLHHGPGHQSTARCRVRGPHERHEAVYGEFDTYASWTGHEAITGFFDDPPEAEER